MTHFEMMLLGRIDALTGKVGELATAVGRLEERQISQDDRLEELERTPPPAPVARASAAPGRSRWCVTKDVGVTGAAIVALVTAIAQAVHAPPPAPPAPVPRPPATSGAGPQ